MAVLFILVLYLCFSFSPQVILNKATSAESPKKSTDTEELDEKANENGFLSSVCQTLNSLFGGGDTTETEAERQEVIANKKKTCNAKKKSSQKTKCLKDIKTEESSKKSKNATEEFDETADEPGILHSFTNLFSGNTTKSEPEGDSKSKKNKQSGGSDPDDEGNSMMNWLFGASPEDKNKTGGKVRATEITKRDLNTIRKKRSLNQMAHNIPMIAAEFNQGETKGGWIERTKKQKIPSDWITEKIVQDSDPIENLDNENYIEEIKRGDFPFHLFTFEPIIVEDTFAHEITTQAQKELPPLNVIEYEN